ncbi:MAG TPA: copper resistance CopC family protein [Candidatus Acidoferrum sp.]|nr:copper resistance CopC family protein [Candidatus Acidoferrum sp.]
MRLSLRFFAVLCLCLVIVGLLLLPIAGAHAILLESSPALNGLAAGPEVPIKLRFNVRIDAMRSRLTLVGPDGSTQALEIAKEAAAETLTSQAKGLAPGQYRIRWQVLASDGHLTRGEIPFTVTKS